MENREIPPLSLPPFNSTRSSEMKNGEGSGEKLPTEPISPSADDLVDYHHEEMDGRDDLCCSSQYSSCGESDFDKYCSANSAIGTPSVCGSVGTVFHEFNDSDFGSMKSFKLGDETSNLRSFQGNRRFSSLSGSSICYRGSNSGSGEGLVGMRTNEGSSSRNEVDVMENLYTDDEWRQMEELEVYSNFNGNEYKEKNIVGGATEQNSVNLGYAGVSLSAAGIGEVGESRRGLEQVSGGLGGLEVLSDIEYDGEEVERCSTKGEMSSRCEHSEGEDSMFGYGTDDDRRESIYSRATTQLFRKGHHDSENNLVMTSTTAFGSDDWDDFMHETGDNPIGIMVQDEPLDIIKSSSLPTVAGDNTLDSKAQEELQSEKERNVQNSVMTMHSTDSTPVVSSSTGLSDEDGHLRDISLASNQVSSARGLGYFGCNSTDRLHKFDERKHWEDEKGIPSNNLLDDIQTTSERNSSHIDKDAVGEAPLDEDIRYGEQEKKQQSTRSNEASSISNDIIVKKMGVKEKIDFLMNPLSDSAVNRPYSVSRKIKDDSNAEFVTDQEPYTLSPEADNNINRTMHASTVSYNHFEEYFTPTKTDTHGLNEFFDEVVHDMEEILLDSNKAPGQNSRFHHPQTPVALRDGGSTASTSGANDAYPLIQHRPRVDGVEVIGAKQKKGDVSLSERLVGVKEYTVYIIRVWSGESHWEVERRYRDFCTLYRSLKKSFADQDWILPSPWASVEQESRKIFGSSSPAVVAERSLLIQECLRSVLHSRFLSSPLDALIDFLFLPKDVPISNTSATHTLYRESRGLDSSLSLGKTISLVVNLWPHKSMKLLLDAQHYTCAGCRRNFSDGKTRMQDLVKTLGWGKPRLCEYSGQLYCSSCHANDTAVLPARVLHYWDFTKYPVSQLAKSYLDSIYDQPMLCVSAVNPRLFAKVPALQHATIIRKRIRVLLPYVRCPFRSSIYRGFGSRRYLLDSSDFFALRDLIDLSKGVFAALPVMIETVSKKILEHITEQCLVCCDVGIPCNARQACNDPSSLIFPFQEGDITKCRTCLSAFHKDCFKKVGSCPCGARLKLDESKDCVVGETLDTGTLDLLRRQGSSGLGLFSGLLSKLKPQVSRDLGEQGPRNSGNVILMGSLSSTSL